MTQNDKTPRVVAGASHKNLAAGGGGGLDAIVPHPADGRQFVPAAKSRGGRKHHKYRPNRADDRRGSGTSTLAGSERVARNRVRADLRIVQLLSRSA